MLKRYFVVGLALLSVLCSNVPSARGEGTTGSDAVVTVIQGKARVYTKGSTTGRLLKKGDTLNKDKEVQVGEKSRIELRFPDGTVMRLGEKTRLKMNQLSFNKQTDSKNVKVDLSVGKLWANVKRLTTADSQVEVKRPMPLPACGGPSTA